MSNASAIMREIEIKSDRPRFVGSECHRSEFERIADEECSRMLQRKAFELVRDRAGGPFAITRNSVTISETHIAVIVQFVPVPHFVVQGLVVNETPHWVAAAEDQP